MADRDEFNDMEELLHTFTTEGQELLDEVEPRLIELKEKTEVQGCIDEEVLNSIFRIFHTIKGSAGFLELNSLQEVTHEAETLLDYYRKGRLTPTGEHIGLLLSTTDFIRKLLGNIETYLHDRGFEPEAGQLVKALNWVISEQRGAAPATRESVPAIEPSSSGKPDYGAEALIPITPDMIEQYVRETVDLLDTIEQSLLDLDRAPENLEIIDRIFRALHTIKGNSGLLGMADMERLSHSTESLFVHVRSGAIRADAEIIKMMLSVIDLIRTTADDIARGGNGKIRGCDILIGFLGEVAAENSGSPENGGSDSGELTKPVEVPVSGAAASPRDAATPSVADEPAAPAPVPGPAPTAERPVFPDSSSAKEQPKDAASVPRRDIRVDLERVDKLVDLVGELALAEMMVVQNPALHGLEAEEFDRAVHHLDRVISELQYVSMSLRMIPIAATFRKLIRLVHDLSYKSSKSVKLVTIGEETEVDKTVVDNIADPLVHIVRNAIDHGIELPEDRKAAGKRETGTVTIEAKHEGGEVWIEIYDDGRGLSREKILKKARQMNFVSGDDSELSDDEVYKFILEPGFSTAEKITEVSGRGVGMDVVRRNLEKINGQVDIVSTFGKGTRFTLRIPLTLALMEGMLVQVGPVRYIMPLLSIRECIRPRREDITVTPDGQEIVQVRSELIPVMRLSQLHRITPEHEALDESLLLVVEYRGKCYCIAVDAVLGQQQAVIKGLSEYVGNVRGASGCTILGDGTVSLILDVESLVEMASAVDVAAVMV